MSITDPRSVLILGAGVSKPFGLSLGSDLIDQIAEGLDAELGAPLNLASVIVSHSPREAFRIAPIGTTYISATGSSLEEYRQQTTALVSRLQTSTHDTIDDFIVDNPALSRLSKIGLCTVLFNQIYQAGAESSQVIKLADGKTIRGFSSYDLKSFTSRFFGRKRNWSHHLINMIRFAIRENQLPKRVSIITFNYDTVLENVLDRVFQDTEYAYSEYSEYIDIAHVHGDFGKLASRVEQPAEMVASWADRVCVVQEREIPQEVLAARERARKWVSKATKVYAVGFAFSGANCRLVGLDEYKGGIRELYYCNYDGNMGITQAVERIFGPLRSTSGQVNRYRIFPAEGTPERSVSVEDWFASGFAGETPA